MKILAAGDLHGDSTLAKRLAKQASDENVDLVILCGDITNDDENVEGLIGPFVAHGKKVFLIPGNHDSFAVTDFLAQRYGVKNLHGTSIRYGDIAFVGCGGAPFGLSIMDEDDLYSTISGAFSKVAGATKSILVCHLHPFGSSIDTFGFPGSRGIRAALDKFKPTIALCGHIHEAEGIESKVGETTVMNVSKKGKVFEI